MVIIKLIKGLGILGLFFLSISLKAQTEADFQNFGASFYQLLCDTGKYPNLEYIRIKNMRQFIDEQDLSDSEKEEWKLKINETYLSDKSEFEQKLGVLVQNYRSSLLHGGKLSFNDFQYQPDPKWKNRYQCSLWLFFEHQGLSSFVQIQFEVYYMGKGLVFIGSQMEEAF